MSTRPPPGRPLPSLPDSDQDFTPDLARKIIEKYQEMLRTIEAETREACAVIAEHPRFANITKVSVSPGPDWTPETGAAELVNSHARRIAAAIRAGKEQP